MTGSQHHPHGMHHGHGWQPGGARHRWLEPFVLVLIGTGTTHGYALAVRLNALGVAQGTVDVGELYRTLRELELAGFVRSAWRNPETGARRREYALTAAGDARLDEWAQVMRERARLVDVFLAAYEDARSGVAGRAAQDREA